MELNRDQIIKALEWCIQSESCEYCEYHSPNDLDCCSIRSDALALIKELTEEIEALGAEKEHLELVVEGKLKRTSALEKQVLALTEENKAWQKELIAEKEKAGKAYYELACEVEDLRAEGEWISVKDRWPKPFVSVLVYMPDEEPHPTVHEGFINKRGEWYAGGFDRSPDEVVAWKEMPEAPKMK